MRIAIETSARDHLITDAEIRSVVTSPELQIGIDARRPNADLVLFVGRGADNEPHIEVIADMIDPDVAVVFHAMMLRRSIVRQLGLDLFITAEFASQRA